MPCCCPGLQPRSPSALILHTTTLQACSLRQRSVQGVGKTFTLELCLRRMGVLPVCLSAGELEDEWAGEPGRRLRERYAFAGEAGSGVGGGRSCCLCCAVV